MRDQRRGGVRRGLIVAGTMLALAAVASAGFAFSVVGQFDPEPIYQTLRDTVWAADASNPLVLPVVAGGLPTASPPEVVPATPYPARPTAGQGPWHSHVFSSGQTTFSYPPNWYVEHEGSTVLALGNRNDDGQLILVGDVPLIDPTADPGDQVDALKAAYRQVSTEPESVEFTGQGQLDSPFHQPYVVGRRADHTTLAKPGVLLATFATDGRHSAFIVYEYIGSPDLPDDIVQLVSRLASTFRFSTLPADVGEQA